MFITFSSETFSVESFADAGRIPFTSPRTIFESFSLTISLLFFEASVVFVVSFCFCTAVLSSVFSVSVVTAFVSSAFAALSSFFVSSVFTVLSSFFASSVFTVLSSFFVSSAFSVLSSFFVSSAFTVSSSFFVFQLCFMILSFHELCYILLLHMVACDNISAQLSYVSKFQLSYFHFYDNIAREA